MKLADITSLCKGDERISKQNYKSMTVLLTVSKVFERFVNKQITDYIEPCLSSLLYGFRKGYTVQHALVIVLEKWKSSVDNG